MPTPTRTPLAAPLRFLPLLLALLLLVACGGGAAPGGAAAPPEQETSPPEQEEVAPEPAAMPRFDVSDAVALQVRGPAATAAASTAAPAASEGSGLEKLLASGELRDARASGEGRVSDATVARGTLYLTFDPNTLPEPCLLARLDDEGEIDCLESGLASVDLASLTVGPTGAVAILGETHEGESVLRQFLEGEARDLSSAPAGLRLGRFALTDGEEALVELIEETPERLRSTLIRTADGQAVENFTESSLVALTPDGSLLFRQGATLRRFLVGAERQLDPRPFCGVGPQARFPAQGPACSALLASATSSERRVLRSQSTTVVLSGGVAVVAYPVPQVLNVAGGAIPWSDGALVGSSLLLVGATPGGVWTVVLVDLATGAVRELGSFIGRTLSAPSLSSDGQQAKMLVREGLTGTSFIATRALSAEEWTLSPFPGEPTAGFRFVDWTASEAPADRSAESASAAFSWSSSTDPRAEGGVSFALSGAEAAAWIDTVVWNFGDGSTRSGSPSFEPTVLNPLHRYASPGSYTATLTVTSSTGEVTSASDEVTVAYHVPDANFTVEIEPTADGRRVRFEATTVDRAFIEHLVWDFDDGVTIEGNPQQNAALWSVERSHSAALNYTAALTLRTFMEISRSDAKPVSIEFLAPNPSFIATPAAEALDEGGSPEGLMRFDASASTNIEDVVEVAWDFGDGTTLSGLVADDTLLWTPTHRYVSAGAYSVVLTLRTWGDLSVSASDSLSINFVQPVLALSHSVDPGRDQAGALLTLSGSDLDALVALEWDFGDGTLSLVSIDPADGLPLSTPHTYTSEGTFVVTLQGWTQSNVQVSASDSLTVEFAKLELSPSDAQVRFGATAEIEAVAREVGALIWSTSCGSLSSPSDLGVLFTAPTNDALCVVSATSTRFPDWMLSSSLRVVGVESVSIDGDAPLQIVAGSDLNLRATVQRSPELSGAVTWTSSDEAIASIDATGLLTALSAGESTIRATSVEDPSHWAEVSVTVVARTYTSSTLLEVAAGTPSPLYSGQTLSLIATVSTTDGPVATGRVRLERLNPATGSFEEASSAPLDGDGLSDPLTVTLQSLGTVSRSDTFRAVFEGANGVAGSTSPELTLSVFGRPTETTLTLSASDAYAGRPTTLAASVVAVATGTTPELPLNQGRLRIFFDDEEFEFPQSLPELTTELGFQAGTHEVRVAFDPLGGDFAPSSSTTTWVVEPWVVPDPPTFTVSEGDGELTIAYVLGADHGQGILGTEVSLNNGATWSAIGASPAPVPAANYTDHTVRLRSVNALGAGPASASQVARPRRDLTPEDFYTTVATGGSHTLMIGVGGTVWAVGNNDAGQLGDGTRTRSITPVQVLSLTDIVSVAAGGSHSLALQSDGTLWAWGRGGEGQLGLGNRNQQTRPRKVNTLPAGAIVVGVAAGHRHTLALLANGEVYAWGYNVFGQIGQGFESTLPITTPRLVQITPTAQQVVQVAAGGNASYALLANGRIRSWGRNTGAQLGLGYRSSSVLQPSSVLALGDVVRVVPGLDHTLAIRATGELAAWGWRDHGAIGNGTNALDPQVQPVTLSGIDGVVYAAAGPNFSLALRDDGSLWAWGNHRLSAGLIGADRTRPRQISASVVPAGAVELAASSVHPRFAWIRLGDGSLFGWGDNGGGQLGTGDTVNINVPTLIEGFRGVHRVALGSTASELEVGASMPLSVSVTRVSDVSSDVLWSSSNPAVATVNASGVVQGVAPGSATITATSSADPAQADSVVLQVIGPPAPPQLLNASAGDGQISFSFTLGADNGRAITQVEFSGDGVNWTPIGGPELASSSFTLHGLENFQGFAVQLRARNAIGPSAASNSIQVQTHPGLLPGAETRIASGAHHNVFIDDTGAVCTWGGDFGNAFGQLGFGTAGANSTTFPTRVAGLSGVVSVAASATHTLALKSDGTVWAWGSATFGAVGPNTSGDNWRPAQIPGLNNVVSIAAGEHFSLALTFDGSVWAWGRNNDGQLGDSTTTHRSTPARVLMRHPDTTTTPLDRVVSIAAGGHHALAIRNDGSTQAVWAWGRNTNGQVGFGTFSARLLRAHEVKTLTQATRIAAGIEHSLAVQGGVVWAWGNNDLGQLALPASVVNRATPTAVSGVSGVVYIAASELSSHAVTQAGRLFGWGSNARGEVVDASPNTVVRQPLRSGWTGVGEIQAGTSHFISLSAQDRVRLHGDQRALQLGGSDIAMLRVPGVTLSFSSATICDL